MRRIIFAFIFLPAGGDWSEWSECNADGLQQRSLGGCPDVVEVTTCGSTLDLLLINFLLLFIVWREIVGSV